MKIGPWVTTSKSAWSWTEGPCACGGVLRLFTSDEPWHRKCDTCGSTWEMSTVVMYLNPRGVPVLPPNADDDARAALALALATLTDEERQSGIVVGGWARQVRA